MKKILFLAFLMVSASTAWAKQVVIQTKNTTMVLDVETGKQPQYVYYGAKLSDYDLQNLQSPRDGRMDAYPAYGMNCRAFCNRCNHTRLCYSDYVERSQIPCSGSAVLSGTFR